MQWQEFWELHRKTILIVLGGVALLIGGWLYSRPAPANPTLPRLSAPSRQPLIKARQRQRLPKFVLM